MSRFGRDNFQYRPLNRWEECLGNKELKQRLQSLVRMYRFQHPSTWMLIRLLVSGPSRTGKTSLIKFFIRCLCCKQLDPQTLNPLCGGSCAACKLEIPRFGSKGLHSLIDEVEVGIYDGEPVPLHVILLNGAHFNEGEMKANLMEWQDYDGLRMIFMDEAHRLVKRSCDESLLVDIEAKEFLWIFGTAHPELLDEMFTNRLIRAETELPEPAEAEEWTVRRCQEKDIPYTEDGVMALVEKCGCVMGQILIGLTEAKLTPGGVTVEFVEKFKLRPEE